MKGLQQFFEGMFLGHFSLDRRVGALNHMSRHHYGYEIAPKEEGLTFIEQKNLVLAIIKLFNRFTGAEPNSHLHEIFCDPRGNVVCRMHHSSYVMNQLVPYCTLKSDMGILVNDLVRLGTLFFELLFEAYYNFQLSLDLNFELPHRTSELYRRRVFGHIPFSVASALNGIPAADLISLRGLASSAFKIPHKVSGDWLQ